jgi:hypothetical protein
MHEKILELGRTHTNKNIFLYFFKIRDIFIFLYFSKILKKNKYI